MRSAPAKTIAQWLKQVTPAQRAALEKLRKQIHAAVPDLEECISYGIPSFKLDGRMFIHFAGWKEHCALYCGKAPIIEYAAELADFNTSAGTVRFDPKHPIPASLVKKLVVFRATELSMKRSSTRPRSSSRSSPTAPRKSRPQG